MKSKIFHTLKFLGLAIIILSITNCQEATIKETQTPNTNKETQTPNTKHESKETFVLVHSAWLGAWSFSYVKDELEKTGHKVVTFDLPGHGNDKTLPKDITMQSYVLATQKVIDAQEGKVILVGHSFGGMVISQVAETRSNKIKKLVYLTAMLVPNNVSFLDAVAPVKTSVALNNLVFSEDKSYVTVKEDKLHEAFGADIPIATFNKTLPLLSPEPTQPLGAKLQLTDDKFGSIPRYYVQTLNDHAIPTNVQEAMFTSMGIDKLYTISNSSHLPIFSNPQLVAKIFADIADDNPVAITFNEKASVLIAVLRASNEWKNGFNGGDAQKAANVYSENAVMTAKPFGTFTGRDAIKGFWSNIISDGFSDVEYINATIKVVDDKHAVIKSDWKMNKAKGSISKELFEIQANGKAELIQDNFSVDQ